MIDTASLLLEREYAHYSLFCLLILLSLYGYFSTILQKGGNNSNDNRFYRFVRRTTGYNQKSVKSFFEREAFNSTNLSRRLEDKDRFGVSESLVEKFIQERSKEYRSYCDESYKSAENFLLLINSGALAGIFALFDQLEMTQFTILHISSVAMFFLSLLFLGFLKWSKIIHSNFLRGELFKSSIRYVATEKEAYDVVRDDYHANGAKSIRGFWAILSFVSFAFGWAFLFALFAGVEITTGQ